MKNNKKSNSEDRVFKTFLLLSRRDMSINELKKHFDDSEIYSNETLYKYINTLLFVGLEVTKENEKYSLKHTPPYYDITDDELEGLKVLSEYNFPETTSQQRLQELLYKFSKHLTENALLKLKSINHQNPLGLLPDKQFISKLENFIKDGLVVKVETFDGTTYLATPLDLETGDRNKVFFKISISDKIYNIDINQIKNIEQMNTKSIVKEPKCSVSFKITGTLKKRYRLRVGEHAIWNPDGSITITSTLEPENLLIKRLLRYGRCCEVLAPIDTRLKIKKEIDNMYSYYSKYDDKEDV